MFNRVVVAGGSGFLGSSVTKELAKHRIPYVSVSRRDGVDFMNLEDTTEILREHECDALINCAAFIGGLEFVRQHVAEILFANSIMSLNLMEAARRVGVKAFMNTLANCSYPARASELKEDEWWDGPLHESVLAYGSTKKTRWVQSWAYHQQFGFNTINLLLPNMYGPHDYFDVVRSHALGALIRKFVEAHEHDEPTVEVWGDGSPIREWLYVEDAAEVCVHALGLSPGIEPINIGIGRGISIRDLAELVQRIVGYQGSIVYDQSKPNGAPSKIMNVERMRERLEWRPRTDFKDGIRSTVEWYRQHRTKILGEETVGESSQPCPPLLSSHE